MTRSTIRVLFYANSSKEQNGINPHGPDYNQQESARFSCQRSIAKGLWDVKGRGKSKDRGARETNFVLDSIKAQIIKHYCYRISDGEAHIPRRKWCATPIKVQVASMKYSSNPLVGRTRCSRSLSEWTEKLVAYLSRVVRGTTWRRSCYVLVLLEAFTNVYA